VSFMNFAPRLMMQLDDLPRHAPGAAGSRISYQLLAAGEREGIRQLEQMDESPPRRGERVDSLDNARPKCARAWTAPRAFLGLPPCLAVVLSAVAIALGTRRYTQRHLDGYAVMRCLGAAQSQLSPCSPGVSRTRARARLRAAPLGFVVQNWSLGGSQHSYRGPCRPRACAGAAGAATGLVLLLGFALPPLLQLKDVPALRVIRRDVGLRGKRPSLYTLWDWPRLFGLLLWQAGELKLASYVFGALLPRSESLRRYGYGALQLISGGSAGPAAFPGVMVWRTSCGARARNAVQIVAIAVGLTAILLSR